MCMLQKKGQAEVVQDTLYCLGGCRVCWHPLLSSGPLPTLSFLLVSHSSFSFNAAVNQKGRKSMFMKAREQMGWHTGRGLLLCFPHRAGVPSLWFLSLGCGYRLLDAST